MQDSVGSRGRGSQHQTAPTANLSPARDGSARPPRSPPQRAGRRAPVSAGRLAMERGGASGRPGLCETSASGVAAIAPLGSRGSPRRARDQSPKRTAPESQPPSPRSRTPSPRCRTPSPRCRTPAFCCSPPQPAMLEQLSSLPTQMVRVRPAAAPAASPPLARWLLRSPSGRPTGCPAVPGSDCCLPLFPSSLPPRESPRPCSVRVLPFPGSPAFPWGTPDVGLPGANA